MTPEEYKRRRAMFRRIKNPSRSSHPMQLGVEVKRFVVGVLAGLGALFLSPLIWLHKRALAESERIVASPTCNAAAPREKVETTFRALLLDVSTRQDLAQGRRTAIILPLDDPGVRVAAYARIALQSRNIGRA